MQGTILKTLKEVQEDWQCTYDVTLRRFCVTIVAVERQ